MESLHAVAVLITSPQGIPLVRDPKKPIPRYWKLAGGRSEGKESAKECAIREISQELGLELDIDALTVIDEQQKHNHMLTFFHIDIPSLQGLKTVGDEQEEIKVFGSLMDVAQLPDFFPNHKTVIQKMIVSGK